MSPGSAMAIATALQAVAIAPFVLASRWRGALLPLFLAALAAVAGLSLFYMGLPRPGQLSASDRYAPPPPDAVTPASPQCSEAINVLEENKILLERSATRVVVNGPTWRQLPEQVRGVLARCLAPPSLNGAPGRAPEIVEQGL